VIAEPSGWESIVLGYKGSQRFTVEIVQPCSHTAGPEHSAPERAVDFWNALVAWCSERSVGSGAFDALTPTLIDMRSQGDGLHARAALHIGLRLPPGVLPEVVRDELQTLLPVGKFSFEPGEPAVRGSRSNLLVAAFLRSIRGAGGTPRFKVKTGTSDMNVVGPVWGCPMAAYGPGDSRLDHTPEERVPIDDYLRAIEVLTRVLVEL
jgi:LysW-gamma-L-lysine carboxypeptidase